jgi:hypothetical protein
MRYLVAGFVGLSVLVPVVMLLATVPWSVPVKIVVIVWLALLVAAGCYMKRG